MPSSLKQETFEWHAPYRDMNSCESGELHIAETAQPFSMVLSLTQLRHKAGKIRRKTHCLSNMKNMSSVRIISQHCKGFCQPGPARIAAGSDNSLLENNAAERTGKDTSRSQGRRQGSHRLILALKLMNAINSEPLEHEKLAFQLQLN